MTEPGIGHNNPPVDPKLTLGRDRLRQFVASIERLEEDKKAVEDDIKTAYATAKATGYDVKVLRAVIARRKADKAKLAEFELLLDTYMVAIGGAE